jgi:hypothetical protein
MVESRGGMYMKMLRGGGGRRGCLGALDWKGDRQRQAADGCMWFGSWAGQDGTV